MNKKHTQKRKKKSLFSHDRYLMGLGTTIIVFELIHAEILGGTYHDGFVILGGSLLGAGLTQLGDRR